MAASTSIKMQPPEKLRSKETATSLQHWKNTFTVYTQRDAIFSPFLTLKWDPAQKDFGFKDETNMPAATRMENCKMFMSHVASFLPEPFWNHRIKERSKCMADIWETFDYVYNIETSAESFLDLALIEYNGTESHHSFLARIIYHIENNK